MKLAIQGLDDLRQMTGHQTTERKIADKNPAPEAEPLRTVVAERLPVPNCRNRKRFRYVHVIAQCLGSGTAFRSVCIAALALFAAMNANAAPTDAMFVYGDNTVGTPKYRIWTNSAWTAESSALSVGSAAINWVVVKACPTRDEYIAATEDANKAIKAQVYRNGSWTNLQTIATAPGAGRARS